MIQEGQHLSVRALGELTNISKSTIHSKYNFFSKHIFLKGPPNTFYINRSSSELIYITDFVLVLFGQYWTILLISVSFQWVALRIHTKIFLITFGTTLH